MIKYSWLKRTLTKATSLQRDIATKHFNQLWEQYDNQVNDYRRQLSNRQISVTTYRKLTQSPWKRFKSELHGVVKLLVGRK